MFAQFTLITTDGPVIVRKDQVVRVMPMRWGGMEFCQLKLERSDSDVDVKESFEDVKAALLRQD